jgi:hypothetical protein
MNVERALNGMAVMRPEPPSPEAQKHSNGDTQGLLVYTAMNISSFGEDEQGELYVVDRGGTVSRIESMAATCTYAFFPPRDRRRNCVSEW